MNFAAPDVRKLGWSVRRTLTRLHRPGVAGLLLLMVSVGLGVFVLPPARERLATLEAQTSELSARARNLKPGVQQTTPRAQLANFYAFFPLTDAVPEVLGKIQRAAQRNELVLAKGEYKLAEEQEFRLARYQITLPVTGAYSQVRGFVNDVLAAVPGVALDELSLKREAIGDDTLEARVRFTLFVATE